MSTRLRNRPGGRRASARHGKATDRLWRVPLGEAKAELHRPLFQAILDASPLRTALVDRDGCVLAANRQMAKGLGLTVPQIIGRDTFSLLPAPHAESRRRAFRKALRTGKPVLQEDQRNGRHFITRYCPAPDAKGRPTRIAIFVLDVTAERKIEADALMHQNQLRSLLFQLCEAEEQERRRIAANLHDNVGHSLALARMKMDELAQAAGSEPVHTLVDQAAASLAEAVSQLRAAVFDLSPPSLTAQGLPAAARQLVRQLHGQRPDMEFSMATRGCLKPLPAEAACFLYRALRELILNVMKHARARRAWISLSRCGNRLRMVVRDDGVGFQPHKVLCPHNGDAKGYGLLNLYARVNELGGNVTVKSAPGQGTTVTLDTCPDIFALKHPLSAAPQTRPATT